MWYDTVFQNMGWSVIFGVVGAVVGVALLLAAAAVLPMLISRLTPALEEGKELAKGNQAVAEYLGRVTAAAVIGASLIIAAAVAAGIIAAWWPAPK
jgi:hypothetical protein